MSSLLMESGGSQFSLERSSSREDSSPEDDISGNESLDPADDRERLSLLDAAVQWIRQELVSLKPLYFSICARNSLASLCNLCAYVLVRVVLC